MVLSTFLPECHQQHVVWMIMWSIFWHKESVWNSCLKIVTSSFPFLQLSLQAHVSLFTSGKDSIKRESPLKLEIWVERGHKRESGYFWGTGDVVIGIMVKFGDSDKNVDWDFGEIGHLSWKRPQKKRADISDLWEIVLGILVKKYGSED